MSALGQRSDSAKAEAGRYPSGADHGTPCAVPLDLEYAAVCAECYPTVAQIRGEWYGIGRRRVRKAAA